MSILEALNSSESLKDAAALLGISSSELARLCDSRELWKAREDCKRRGLAARVARAHEGTRRAAIRRRLDAAMALLQEYGVLP